MFEHFRAHVVGGAREGGGQVWGPHENARDTEVTWKKGGLLTLTTNRPVSLPDPHDGLGLRLAEDPSTLHIGW